MYTQSSKRNETNIILLRLFISKMLLKAYIPTNWLQNTIYAQVRLKNFFLAKKDTKKHYLTSWVIPDLTKTSDIRSIGITGDNVLLRKLVSFFFLDIKGLSSSDSWIVINRLPWKAFWREPGHQVWRRLYFSVVDCNRMRIIGIMALQY